VYEILEHTADIGIRAWGVSLPDLFVNSALAVQSIALDAANARALNRYSLEASGEDEEALLVNWLNEVIYYLDGRRVVFARLEVPLITSSNLRAEARGEPRDPERHPARLVVKAATYHQLKLHHPAGQDHWMAEVFLDI
jgi:SHS2 domain-containing protein